MVTSVHECVGAGCLDECDGGTWAGAVLQVAGLLLGKVVAGVPGRMDDLDDVVQQGLVHVDTARQALQPQHVVAAHHRRHGA